MFMTGRKWDDFAIKRKFEVVYVTSIKKNMISVFSGLNDISSEVPCSGIFRTLQIATSFPEFPNR